MTDYSIYADLLARLQAATSEEEKGWMLMEFSLNQLPPTVREAVWAAAIPHQFDRELLGTLLTGHPKPSRDFKQAKKKSKICYCNNPTLNTCGTAVMQCTKAPVSCC